MIELRGIEAYNGAETYKNKTGKKTDEREFDNILTGHTVSSHETEISDLRENKYEYEYESFNIKLSTEMITYDVFGKVSKYYKQAGISIDISV